MDDSKIKVRESNYDLLRLSSLIAVIMIHVSGTWVSGFSEAVRDGGLVTELMHPLAACIFNSLSRFAVPCFLMLSGAFLLRDEKNKNYRYFYCKTFRNLGVTTIVFSFLYILYRIPLCFVGERHGIQDVMALCFDVISGAPMYHMWYMYMLIGVYLMVPVVLVFKDSITEKAFSKVSLCFLILACISQWTAKGTRMHWDIGQSFEHLGYVMIGYEIRKDAKKNNSAAVMLILAGFLMEGVAAYIEYYVQIINGIAEAELKYEIVSPYNPIIVIASLAIFSGFSMLNVKDNKFVAKLSSLSFLVYLIHVGVWDIICKGFKLVKGADYIYKHLDNIFWVPAFTLIVLMLSAVLSLAYIRLCDLIRLKIKD